jgi:hypothetical protein
VPNRKIEEWDEESSLQTTKPGKAGHVTLIEKALLHKWTKKQAARVFTSGRKA